MFVHTVSGAGGSRAAVAGARRPIAQAKISSETGARIIGGASFYARESALPPVGPVPAELNAAHIGMKGSTTHSTILT